MYQIKVTAVGAKDAWGPKWIHPLFYRKTKWEVSFFYISKIEQNVLKRFNVFCIEVDLL